MPTYTAPAPQRSRRGGLIALAVLGILVVVIGGGVYLFRDRLTGNVNELAVGDCIDEPANSSNVTDVQHQPCASPHDGEVFFLITDPGSGVYPGDTHFRTLAEQQCLPAATAYLGSDFATRPDLDAGFFYPTSDSWSNGDRGLTCYMYRIDRLKLTGPVKGLGTSPLPGPQSS